MTIIRHMLNTPRDIINLHGWTLDRPTFYPCKMWLGWVQLEYSSFKLVEYLPVVGNELR